MIKLLQGPSGLAISLSAILTLAFAAPGSVIVAFVLLRPAKVMNRMVAGELDVSGPTLLSLMALGIFVAAAICMRILRSVSWVARMSAAPPIAFACVAVLVGAFIWIVMGFREPELALRLPVAVAQTVLGFSVLWSGRVLAALFTSWRIAPRVALRGIAFGLIGSTVGAALGGAVAVARGLEPSPFDSPHWFYVLAVPAMAAFGWAAPRPPAASTSFAVIAVLFTAVTALIVPLMLVATPPEVVCDWGVWNPHYVVLGFEWEPWRWRLTSGWSLIPAPSALTELSLLHIFDPVPKVVSPEGGYCPE
ncbi:MAG TPA: hypothetical protein VED46_19180 [Alphaproteobacteria bacterium]|nr:hypothetical protein [Alphaproteobacteria bacterium]